MRPQSSLLSHSGLDVKGSILMNRISWLELTVGLILVGIVKPGLPMEKDSTSARFQDVMYVSVQKLL